MGPETWVTIAAVFVSGGAIGSAGTLLAQWLLRSVDGHGGKGSRPLDPTTVRREISLINRHLRNLESRVDFTEQLLGGAITALHPPEPLEPDATEDASLAEGTGEGDP